MEKIYLSLLFMSLSAFLSLSLGCSEEQKSIKVGYIGCLSGKCSPLGVSGRDGVLFAAEQINKNGGIKSSGAKIEVVAVDTRGQKEIAKQSFAELLSNDVEAVIGPMTSEMGVTLKPLADSSKTVLLSPTVSTTQLSNIDDYFFRIMTTVDTTAPLLANYAVNIDKRQSYVIAYDEVNTSFSSTWIDVFSKNVKKNGGQILGLQPLNDTLPMTTYAKRIYGLKPDGLLIVANSHNTGLLIQQLNKLGSKIQIMGTEWSTTGDLQSISGRALEKAYFITSYNSYERDETKSGFVSNFQKRFGAIPSFSAKYGFEAMTLLSHAISNISESNSLKESLLNLGPIQGLQDTLETNRYGDIQRDVYVMKYKDNRFVVVAKGDSRRLVLM